jgi:hypothetical protein
MPSSYQAGLRFLQRVLLSDGRSVVPLYIGDPGKGLRFLGSAIYCRHHNIELLFTARHVVEDAWPKRFWYPHSRNEARPLPCDGFHMTDQQTDDFCIAQLTSGLPAWRPFEYGKIDAFCSYKEYQHLLVGYPGSYTKKSTRGIQRLKLQGYLTSPAPDREYTRLNVSPEKEMVFLFRKEKVFDEKRELMNFPDPNGMSGGAVFQFNENVPQLITLVGIMTKWDTSRKNAIIATKCDAIKTHFTLQKIV